MRALACSALLSLLPQVRKELEAAEQGASAARERYAALKQALTDAEAAAAVAALDVQSAKAKVNMAEDAAVSSDGRAALCRQAVADAQVRVPW